MENRKETLARVLRFAKPYRWYLLAALVSAVLSVSLTLYAPVLIGRGIDQIIAPGKVYFDNLLPILIELGIVAVLAAIFQWLLTLCTNIVTYKTVRDLRSAAFEHMEELPLSNIDSRPHGDIISRIINDIDSVSDGLLQGFSQLFTGIITIAITLVYMLAINFKVGLVVVVITPLSLFVASFIAKHSFDMFRRQSAIKGQLSGCIEELVGNQKVVKAFSYEERAQQQFEPDQPSVVRRRGQGSVLFFADQSLHPLCQRSGLCGGCHRRRALLYCRRIFGGCAVQLFDLRQPVHQGRSTRFPASSPSCKRQSPAPSGCSTSSMSLSSSRTNRMRLIQPAVRVKSKSTGSASPMKNPIRSSVISICR